MREIENTPTEKASGESSCTGLAAWSFGRQDLSAIESLSSKQGATASESWLPTIAFGNGGDLEERGTGLLPEKDNDDIENRGMGWLPEKEDNDDPNMRWIEGDGNDDIENRGMGWLPEKEDNDDPNMRWIEGDGDDDIENRGMGWLPEREDMDDPNMRWIEGDGNDDIENRGMGYLRDAVNQAWESIASDGSIMRFDAQGRTLARTSLTDFGSIITEFDPDTGDVSRSTETRLGQSGEHIVTLRNSAGHTVLESQITGDETESRVVTTSYGENGKPIFLTRQSSASNAYLVLDPSTGGIIQSGAVDESGNWQYENSAL